MSRKLIVCISSVLTICLILYLASEGVMSGYNTIDVFFDVYVDNAQKYLLNGSLYGIPLIYAFSRPFMSSEYRIRFRKNMAYKLITKAIINAMIMGAWIMLLFIVASLIMNIQIDFTYPLITVYIRYVILYAQCGGLYYLIYAISNSEIIAVCGVLLSNWIVLMVIATYNFIVEPLGNISINIFLWYVSISCLCAFVLLNYVIKYRKKNI